MQSEQAKERRHVVDIQRIGKSYLTGTGNVRISYASLETSLFHLRCHSSC